MLRIFALTQDPATELIVSRFAAWAASELIDDLYVATSLEGSTVDQVVVRHIAGKDVTTMSFGELLNSLSEVPMLINVCLGLPDGRTLTGKTVAELLYRSILESVDAESEVPKVTVFATATPSVRFDSSPQVTWSDRFFLAPEDRARPSASLGHLDPDSVPGHIASGLVSLCGLWRSPTGAEGQLPAVIDEVMSQGTQGPQDLLYLYRHFVRIVEFPTIVPEILELTARELRTNELPNPDQAHFERTSLSDYLPEIAQAFIVADENLQVGEPRLVPPEPAEQKLGLLEALRAVINQALQQLVLKPAQILDEVLGHYYDEIASGIERLAPGGSVSIVRWRELGKTGHIDETLAEEFSQDLDRLAEPDMTKTWTTYRELCLGLLDGARNNGTNLVVSKLFQSSQDRQMISPYPSEIVGDPLTTHNDNVTDAVSAPIETTDSVETVADAVIPVSSPTLTLSGQIRKHLEDEISNSHDVVTKYHAEQKKSLEEGAANPAEVAVESQRKVRRQISRTVRGTFGAIVATVGIALFGAFFMHNHLHGWLQHLICGLIVVAPMLVTAITFRGSFVPAATIVEIALISQIAVLLHIHWQWFLVIIAIATILQSPLWLAMSIWKSSQMQKAAEKAIKESVRTTVNNVLAEAHYISAAKRLERRLREFDDWQQIVGLVAHHPYVFDVSAEQETTTEEMAFPASVAHGTAQLAQEDIIRIASSFRHDLFSPGWLNARYNQLRESLIEGIYVKLGASRENGVLQIEGDTSSDLQSPRKVFGEALMTAVQTQTSDVVLIQLNKLLDQTSLTDLVDHIEYCPQGGQPEEVQSAQFLQEDLAHKGSMLPSHWRESSTKEMAAIESNRLFGDSEHVTLIDGGHSATPKIIIGTVQLTERLAPSLLAAFTKETD